MRRMEEFKTMLIEARPLDPSGPTGSIPPPVEWMRELGFEVGQPDSRMAYCVGPRFGPCGSQGARHPLPRAFRPADDGR